MEAGNRCGEGDWGGCGQELMNRRLRLLAFGLLLSSVAAGQSDTTVTAAREIARQGLKAYDAGRYEEAADKLSRAYAVVKLPTLALHTARALVKVGRLVEATRADCDLGATAG